jgi:Macrocin-O-methyltransferase (TylF)
LDRFDYLIRTLTRIDGLTGDDYQRRYKGLDWPTDAETMVGVERLTNVKTLALDVIERGIPGDFMECGIWRGGVGILMGAIIQQEAKGRRLFLADSFEGCPIPNPAQYPADTNDPHHTFGHLKVSSREVIENFRKYGLLPFNGLHVLEGWFKDTLRAALADYSRGLALLRLDGDMYESTIQALEAAYDRVTPGGYVILDDYHNIPNCRKAILDFRAKRRITTPIQSVDWCAVYWQKEAEEGRAAA